MKIKANSKIKRKVKNIKLQTEKVCLDTCKHCDMLKKSISAEMWEQFRTGTWQMGGSGQSVITKYLRLEGLN